MKTKNNSRPPIVVVLGHVDHGKTTLLDKIRKANVASGEDGAITQKIGAYQTEVDTKSGKKKITFIDTPGHEAFSKIRSRGAQLADIAILVVAADDGVKPQTKESIDHIKKANIPFIVAINKTDLSSANPEKAKQMLTQHNVLVESLGGDVVVVEISAKTGKGINNLLEMILLVAEMQELPSYSNKAFQGVVIEAKKDIRRGILATVVVKQGTLKVSDKIYGVGVEGKVKALFDEYGKSLKQAPPSKPVEVLGFKTLPLVGTVLSSETIDKQEVKSELKVEKKEGIESLFSAQKGKRLKIIIKADATGSLDAIIGSLPKEIEVVHSAVGEIVESDVLLAQDSNIIVIGFNTKATSQVKKLAREEGVKIKTYSIIYKMLEELEEVCEILGNPDKQEQIQGVAVIVAEFPFEDLRVAGCKIVNGKITKGSTIKLVREEKEVGRSRIRSLQQGKDKVDKVEKGQECGILLDKKLDFQIQDSIISYKDVSLF